MFGKTIPCLLGLLLAVGQGCSDTDKPPFVPRDGGWQRDGGQIFLGTCTQDTDCASGHCLSLGGIRRCSRSCGPTAPCPALGGWRCTNQSVCFCEGPGKEPNLCNVDGDCDGLPDRDPQPETCNGADDDCNGIVDDVAPATAGAKLYYADADGDGFGDQNSSRWSCQPPPAHVENKQDCDDARKDVNPAMVEPCVDSIDHDCDGLKWDADICGLVPILVSDVDDPAGTSATLSSCPATSGIDPGLDVTEIVAKQDATRIKYTVRLAGAPQTSTCASYVLRLGSFAKVYDLAYVYRPATTACAGLPAFEAYLKGQKITTTGKPGFNAADPGHVSFTLDKTEFFPALTIPSGTPSYYLKACTNASADAVKDLTACASDSCETPVRRQ